MAAPVLCESFVNMSLWRTIIDQLEEDTVFSPYHEAMLKMSF